MTTDTNTIEAPSADDLRSDPLAAAERLRLAMIGSYEGATTPEGLHEAKLHHEWCVARVDGSEAAAAEQRIQKANATADAALAELRVLHANDEALTAEADAIGDAVAAHLDKVSALQRAHNTIFWRLNGLESRHLLPEGFRLFRRGNGVMFGDESFDPPQLGTGFIDRAIARNSLATRQASRRSKK